MFNVTLYTDLYCEYRRSNTESFNTFLYDYEQWSLYNPPPNEGLNFENI